MKATLLPTRRAAPERAAGRAAPRPVAGSPSAATRRSRGRLLEAVSLLMVLAVMAVLLARRLYDSSLAYPDAAQIRMDGVFLLDFLKALPLDRVYEFTARYYAQYPALSLGYRPPVFPMMEATFNAVFGLNVWSSRLAILPFALAGVVAWFALVRRMFDASTAAWASLLFVTTPFFVQWGWYTMNDIPVMSLAMVLAYLFYRSTEDRRPRYVYAAALVFVTAVWTKQTAIFLVLWLLLYLFATGRVTDYLRRKHVWIALGITLLALVPLAALTMWLGAVNISQSIGSGENPPVPRLHWWNFVLYLWILVGHQVTPPVLALSVVGAAVALWRRDRRTTYFGLLIVATYAFFTYVIAKDERYTLFWLPPITLFAALLVFYLRSVPAWRRTYMGLLALVVLYQTTRVYAMTPFYAAGYDRIADALVRRGDAQVVFFDGVNNGNFVYFVRVLDRDRSIRVLRGDKLLTSSAMSKLNRLSIHAHSRQDIQEIFDRYGVVYIVVESDEQSPVPIHHELRDFLATARFELIEQIAIDSNWPLLAGQTLKLYRYLEPKPPTADRLELRVPLVGPTISVPLGGGTGR